MKLLITSIIPLIHGVEALRTSMATLAVFFTVILFARPYYDST
jgi:hypothetical protein